MGESSMNTVLALALKMLSSNLTKQLIGLAIKKLLEHKSDGITKDVIEVVLDGAVASKSNNLSASMADIVKLAL
jgi:hypothetical protein